jgi:hypothetical protein
MPKRVIPELKRLASVADVKDIGILGRLNRELLLMRIVGERPAPIGSGNNSTRIKRQAKL